MLIHVSINVCLLKLVILLLMTLQCSSAVLAPAILVIFESKSNMIVDSAAVVSSAREFI